VYYSLMLPGVYYSLMLPNVYIRLPVVYQAGYTPTRFTVGQAFVRQRFLTFSPERGNQAAIALGYGPPGDHPFHCWVVRISRYSQGGLFLG